MPVIVIVLVTLGALAFPNGGAVYAAVIALVFVAIGLRSPRAAWIVYVASLCLSGLEMDLGGVTVLPEHVALIPAFFHVVSAVLSPSKRARNLNSSAVASLGAFAFWLATSAVTSIATSPDAAQSLKLLAWVVLNLVAGVLFYLLGRTTVAMVRDALVVLLGYGVACAGVWLFVTVTNQPTMFVERDYASAFFRLKGLMLEPNLIAALFVLGACVGLVFVREIPPALFIAYITISSVVVVASFTRVSGLLLFIVLVTYVWPRLGAAARAFAVLLALLAAAVASASPAAMQGGDDLISVLTARATGLLDLNSGTGAFRARTVSLALEDMMRQGVLNGHGFNAFPQVHESDLTSDGRLYLGFLWLVVFYDGGIVGGIFFLVACAAAWAAMGFRRGMFFMVSFALIATTTNPVWFAFPWVWAAILMRPARLRPPNNALSDNLLASVDATQRRWGI